jgi:hypothetical protein
LPPICDFIGALTVADKSFKEIKKTVKSVYGDKALKRTQIYKVKKKPAADHRGFIMERYIRNSAFVAKIAAEMETDRFVTVKKLARAHGMSKQTIHATMHKYLNLSKKFARWAPKLLNDDMKKAQARTNKVPGDSSPPLDVHLGQHCHHGGANSVFPYT